MPKPWGPVLPWTHLLLSTGSLKEPKHQHNSNLSPSRTRNIYAPQEQWLYTWNGCSWKTCKVQKKSWEGNAVCPAILMLCCVGPPDLPRMVLQIQLIRTQIPRTSAGVQLVLHLQTCNTAQSNPAAGRWWGRFSAHANHRNSLHSSIDSSSFCRTTQF